MLFEKSISQVTKIAVVSLTEIDEHNRSADDAVDATLGVYSIVSVVFQTSN